MIFPAGSTATMKRFQSRPAGLIPTRLTKCEIWPDSDSSALRRVKSAKRTCRNQDNKCGNEPMDQERPDEGPCLPCHPSKGEATKDRGQGLDLGLTDVRDREGHSL